MSGTVNGGLKAADKNKKSDPNFYKKIGKLGGSKSHGGGFSDQRVGKDGLTGRQRASIVGKLGGKKSRKHSSITNRSQSNG